MTRSFALRTSTFFLLAAGSAIAAFRPSFKLDYSSWLVAEFPKRVTVVEIPHAGHALLPEQPEQVEKAILAHLQR